MMYRRFWSVVCACAVGGVATGCRTVLRHPLPVLQTATSSAPWGLREEYFAPEAVAVVFVVYHAEGEKPSEKALDELTEFCAQYSGASCRWVWGESVAKELEWDNLGVVTCRKPWPLRERHVFVRYVGHADSYAFMKLVEAEGCGAGTYFGIFIAQDRVPGKHLEARTLKHEFAHVLGLGTNPAHCYDIGVLGGHCRNPDCILAPPTGRSVTYAVLRGLFTFRLVRDLCRECQADIRAAKDLWGNRNRHDADSRSPSADREDLAGRASGGVSGRPV